MIASLLLLIDLFGKPVTLNFFGRDRFRSRFGGLCSLLFFGFLAWALYNSSADMFNRQNPTSINSEIYEEDPKAVTLAPDNFPIAVKVETPLSMGMRPFKNDSIFTLEFRYASISKDGFNVYSLAQEPCTPSHFGEMADSFSQLIANTSFCIAKEQPNIKEVEIQGVYTSPVNKLMVVVISPCNNATSSVTCATNETIKEHLTGAWAYIYFTDMGVDPNNFTNPNSRFRTSYNTMMSPSTYKESYAYLSPVHVTTDAGWLMSEKEMKTYIKVQKVTEQLQLEPNADNMLLAFGFQMSTTEIYYSRSYKKIQNVLAEVGGLANVVLVALIVLTAPYLNLKLRESLINDLFDIHPIDPKKKQSKKKKKQKSKDNGIRDSASTNYQDKNQDTDRKNILEKNKGNEMIETNYMISSPNHKSLFNKEPIMSHAKLIGQSKPKRTGTMQTEGEPFYMSPQLPSYQASFLSNQEAKSSDTSENKMIDKNYKDAKSDSGRDNIWHKTQPDSNLNKKAEPINTVANEHISLKIKGEAKAKSMTNSVRSKVNMTKVMNKQDISDSLSAIFGDDDFAVTSRENNKQELDFPLSPLSPLSSEQKDIELEEEKEDKNEKEIEIDKINSDENNENNENVILQKPSRPSPTTLDKQPYKISISFGEYLWSFIHKSESIRQKLQILDEGSKKLNIRIDIVTILKKMREIDKLKAMVFDLDQARLFDNLPKPELGTKSLNRVPDADSSPYGILRSFTIREQSPTGSKLYDVQSKLENKANKTEIDKRFIAVFREKYEKI